MRRVREYRLLAAAAIAVCVGSSGTCAGQDLPPKTTWSKDPPAFSTVAEAFSQLSKLGTPYLSRDKTQVSFSIQDVRWRGMWSFSGGDVTTHPTRYWRLMILPGNDWNIKISWGCEESKSVCERFRKQIGDQLPPVPPGPPLPSSDLSVKLAQPPVMPRDFLCADFHTTTSVVVSVSKEGESQDAAIESSSGDRSLDQAALDAVKRYEFNPEIFNGHPVAARARIPFVFNGDPGGTSECARVRAVALLADVQSGHELDRNSVATFAAGSAVWVQIKHDLPVGTNLLVRWVDDSKAGVVMSERRVSSDGSGVALTGYLPEGGWKNGTYHVEVHVGFILVGWIRFVVKQPPAS
jgi:TonB family protein